MRPFRVPRRLRQRPQYKGLPIPYIAMIGDDGTPDFRVTHEGKRLSVIKYQLCQLCGQGLGRFFFFIGGTEAAKSNAYFEPACHLDCLIYAMQVCPFIVGKMEHAEIAKVQQDYASNDIQRYASGVTIKADDTFAVKRNPHWVIKKAVGWRIAQTPDKTLLLVPDAIKETPPIHAESMTAAEWVKVTDWLMA